ncbi:hypothetical protein BVX97_01880 [bacterium E08(2017)]|nr:hypothetical protein BVX97_01880 [bacterium E08(2017)]
MKSYKLIGLLILVLATGCASTGSTANFDSISLTGSTEAVLVVHGLSCPLCSNNLDGQLMQIDGVKEANIDLKTGEVTITMSDNHSVSGKNISEAVKNAGFTLKSITPKQ